VLGASVPGGWVLGCRVRWCLVRATEPLYKQIVFANHDPERKRRQRAGVGPREQ
jgi:hypothetical protein